MSSDQLHSIQQWVDYIQTLHAREIELSLDRTRDVFERLLPNGLSSTIISIAGTNGKGSTAQLLNHMYVEAGYSVGKYTSPHILKFNERIQINASDVSDADLLAAFKRVETAREDTPLTFFEFGTLVAISMFDQSKLDVVIMEVGLGGRLDAVNILDCDLAIITSISLDHTAWLGDTVDLIAVEKAGIVRREKPVVIGETRNDESLLKACKGHGAVCYQLGDQFSFRLSETGEGKFEPNDECVPSSIPSAIPSSKKRLSAEQSNAKQWSWLTSNARGPEEISGLALPFKQWGVQLNNAACALQAISLMQAELPVSDSAIRTGLETAQMYGRCQVISKQPLIVLDVAHNQDSVRTLDQELRALNPGAKVLAVCGMLKDKEIRPSLAEIAEQVDVWYVGTIVGARGSSSEHIAHLLTQTTDNGMSLAQSSCVSAYTDILEAFKAARSVADEQDCVVVFGSFLVVADILAYLSETG